MTPTIETPAQPARSSLNLRKGKWGLVGAGLLTLAVAGGGLAGWLALGEKNQPEEAKDHALPAKPPRLTQPAVSDGEDAPETPEIVVMSVEQQEAVGLKTEKAQEGSFSVVVDAPGLVAPNETQYAFITPRAAGVVRSVTAHIGQDVQAGALLATIDSPEVGDARLELYSRLQALDVARAEAEWEEKIFANTLELVERLQRGEPIDTIHNVFANRPVGENREKLLTAYAQYRLQIATMERNRELYSQNLITTKQFEAVKAGYEVAQATYQSLMDEMGFQARLANIRAQQARRQAETAVRAARERLRILGVDPEESERTFWDTIRPSPDRLARSESGTRDDPASPSGEASQTGKGVGSPEQRDWAAASGALVSTYSIWAPFDGTILDREMIVPGVAVDKTHRIFTLADLSSVYIEAYVHEHDFGKLIQSQGGKIRVRARAYPSQVFEGEVIYTGDLVDPESRSVKLLALAPNPDRLLKPGMFVDVEIFSPKKSLGVQIPASALLGRGSRSFVFVRVSTDRFELREVDAEAPSSGMALVRAGLNPGIEVVVEGAYKLKALASRGATSEPSP